MRGVKPRFADMQACRLKSAASRGVGVEYVGGGACDGGDARFHLRRRVSGTNRDADRRLRGVLVEVGVVGDDQRALGLGQHLVADLLQRSLVGVPVALACLEVDVFDGRDFVAHEPQRVFGGLVHVQRHVVEQRVHRRRVLAQGLASLRRLLHDAEGRDGGSGIEGRQGGREAVARAGQALMRRDRLIRDREPPNRRKCRAHGAADERHVGGLHQVVLAAAAARRAQRPERHALFQKDPELELVGKRDDLRERADHASVLIQAFDHDEAAVQHLGRLLAVRLRDDLQDSLEVSDVVVAKLLDVRARKVEARQNCVVHRLVANDQISTLEEGRDDRGDGGHVVGVDDSGLRSHEVRQLLLELQMHVDRAVEATGPAGAHAVLADRALAILLDRVLAQEVEEVERRKVHGLHAVNSHGASALRAQDVLLPLDDAVFHVL
mmetsp:Transcript_37047/g.87213  ORF Transcript_37047/g.87213 Transcript_37047/m.87213 type:complete len:437 (-) Transcript_37047:363-1673(-)